MSIESFAIQQLKCEASYLKRHGFNKAIRSFVKSHGQLDVTDDLIDDIKEISLIPDLYGIAAAPGGYEIVVVEIEDTSKLGRDKLLKYARLYYLLDYSGVFCRLYVTDRYGHNRQEIDLYAVYFWSLKQ